MLPLLITYDLKDKAYEAELLKFLKEELSSHMVAESSYLTVTDRASNDIVTRIRQLTHDKIRVYALTVSGWAGYGPEATNDALSAVLG